VLPVSVPAALWCKSGTVPSRPRGSRSTGGGTTGSVARPEECLGDA